VSFERLPQPKEASIQSSTCRTTNVIISRSAPHCKSRDLSENAAHHVPWCSAPASRKQLFQSLLTTLLAFVTLRLDDSVGAGHQNVPRFQLKIYRLGGMRAFCTKSRSKSKCFIRRRLAGKTTLFSLSIVASCTEHLIELVAVRKALAENSCGLVTLARLIQVSGE